MSSKEDASGEKEEDEIRRRLFAHDKHRPRNADLIVLEEVGQVEITDPDVADWAEGAVRRKFGFHKQKDRERIE